MSRSPRNASARRLRRVAARMAWHRVDWRQRLGCTGSRANGRRRGATRRYVAPRSTGGHADCVGRSRSALGIDRRRREVASRIGERPLGTATSKNPSHDGIGPDSRAFASHGHGPDTVRPPICFFTPDSPNYAVAGTLTRVSFMPGLSCTSGKSIRFDTSGMRFCHPSVVLAHGGGAVGRRRAAKPHPTSVERCF